MTTRKSSRLTLKDRLSRLDSRAADPTTLWTDYQITNRMSGKTYCVALRGQHLGESYCSCPDYRKHTFGLCKHTIHVLRKARRKHGKAALAKPSRLCEP